MLRLRDGETQVLAGLISDEDRRSADRVPGIGDLPVLGRLFSQHHRQRRRKTEIVLLITPRLVRTLARPDARLGRVRRRHRGLDRRAAARRRRRSSRRRCRGESPAAPQRRSPTSRHVPAAGVQPPGAPIHGAVRRRASRAPQ